MLLNYSLDSFSGFQVSIAEDQQIASNLTVALRSLTEELMVTGDSRIGREEENDMIILLNTRTLCEFFELTGAMRDHESVEIVNKQAAEVRLSRDG
jgi:hypothetical protein